MSAPPRRLTVALHVLAVVVALAISVLIVVKGPRGYLLVPVTALLVAIGDLAVAWKAQAPVRDGPLFGVRVAKPLIVVLIVGSGYMAFEREWPSVILGGMCIWMMAWGLVDERRARREAHGGDEE